MTRRMRRRAAFTLMEVLLVLVILVILAAAVVIPLSNTQGQALRSAARNDVAGIERGSELYHLHMMRYPPTIEALIVPPSDAQAGRWKGPYIDYETIPNDPWGQPYQYRQQGQNNRLGKPDIYSVGPDGVEGSEDDVGNWQKGV